MKIAAIFFSICSLAISSRSFSQDGAQELMAIKTKYEQMKSISFQVTYKTFVNHISTIPIQTSTGAYKASGKLFYQELDQVKVIQNEHFILAIDSEDKEITVNLPVGKNVAMPDFNFATMKQFYEKVECIHLTPEKNVLKLIFFKESISEFELIEMEYHPATYLVSKTKMYYKNPVLMGDDKKSKQEKPRMEMEYLQVDSTELSAEIFSEKPYIIKQGKVLTCTAGFNEYELTDLRIKK